MYQIQHPWEQLNTQKTELSTNSWLMSYGQGIQLPYIHWEQISHPKFIIPIFKSDESGELAGAGAKAKVKNDESGEMVKKNAGNSVEALEPPKWWKNGVAKWNRLNNKEKDIIKWDVEFYKANDIEENADIAFRITKSTFGEQGQGDKSDAFRHAIWQATNTQDVGEDFTRKWSDAHEYSTPIDEVKTDLYMDIHNNDVGIEIGKANPTASLEKLRDIILERIERGDFLIKNKDGTALIKSDGKGLKTNEIRKYGTANKIAVEILNNPNNQKTKDYE